jgi:hypothetical protein
MATSPDTSNYFIGTGIVSFSTDDGATWRDLGNCPTFKYTPDVTTKEHKSSRGGIKSTDVERVTEVKATVDFDLDEVTGENLAYFALADVDTDTNGDTILMGLTNTQITGLLKLEGQNDIGNRITWQGEVQFIPSGSFELISDNDDYGKISVKAKVLKSDDGSYGQWTIADAEA